ncbi:cadherin domain-containing protein [Hymenobacter lucidus]|uniref:Cadherin domain-containing protein n=1 Tax=Hymenobacter lucidus TaxID=2880930 RepID=A0ABS8ARH5_9BACT|nr:cadherin domain-containing protein [Hymenobacter lucidus]MCB2408613.1 cadherin domain-containing protein [Hymenobacter lucidus]
MRKPLLLLLLLLSTLTGWAQAPTWQGIYSTNPVQGSLPAGYNIVCQVQATALNAAGDMLVVGTYSGSVDFPKVGGGNIRITTNEYSTMYVGKWSTSSKAWLWVVGTPGASGYDIAVNGSDVYVTGSYGGGSSTIAGTLLTNANTINDSDGFLAKYIDNGSSYTNGWAQKFGGSTVPSTDAGQSIAISGNNLYLTGKIYGTSTLAGLAITSAGQADMFLAKFDLTASPATPVWALSGGGPRTDQGYAVGVNGNRVYVGGSFASTLNIAGQALTTPALNDRNIFLAKVIDNGTTYSNGWAVNNGGSATDDLYALKVIGSDLFFTGFYAQGTAGASIAGTTLTAPSTNLEMYVGKYTDAGTSATPRWAIGVPTASGSSQGNELAVSGTSVFVTGTFSGTVPLGGTSQTSVGTTGGDVYVARYTDNTTSAVGNGSVRGGSTVDSDSGLDLEMSGSTLYASGYARAGATFGSYTISSTGISTLALLGVLSATNLPAAPTISGINPNSGPIGTPVTVSGSNLGSASAARVNGTPGAITSNSTGSLVFTVGGGSTTGPVSVSTGGGTASFGTFTVTSSNSAPTDIALSNASVSENAGANATVGTLSTTDPNAGNTFTYSLVSGAGSGDNGSFNISGATLRLTASADFETKTSYSVRIRTTDQGGLTYDESFTITITNVNEAPTDIALSSNSVAENQAVNTTVGTFSGNDPDAGSSLSYSLVTGSGSTDNASFNLSGTTLRTSASFNFEVKSSYSIRVRVSDGNLNYEESFAVNVTNQNETPTDIALSSTSVAENQANNTTVGTLSTTDPDAGNTFTYSLVTGTGSTDNASFNISGGNLRTSASFNFEAKNSYLIRVRTTDQGGLTYDEAFTITITNVNEAPTDLILSSNSVAENRPTNTTVGTLSTTDPDASNTFTYTLVTGAGSGDNASFNISGATLRTSAVFDFETKNSYAVRIRTTDQGGLTYDQAFTITVINVDDTAPTANITSTATSPTATSPIPVTVTFSENVTGFTAGGVNVSNGSVSGFGGSGTTYTFTVTPGTSGVVTVNVPASVAIDGAGNNNTAAPQFSITYNPPVTVTSITRNLPGAVATATVSYTVTLSGPVTGLTTNNFNLTVGGVAGSGVASLSGSGTTYTVVANTGTGNGTIQLNLANGAGVSAGISNAPFAGETYTITKSFTAPVLKIEGTGNGSGGDVTAFVDEVLLLQNGTSTAVSGALLNPGFETYDALANTTYGYTPTGASWTFLGGAGIAKPGNGFNPPTPLPGGAAVAFVQSGGSNGALEQSLVAPVGIFQVRFQTAQRNYLTANQRLNVFINNVFVGAILPGSVSTYDTFTSSPFTVTAAAPTDIVLSNASVTENLASGTAVGTLSTTSVTPSQTYTYALVAGSGSTDNTAFNISGSQLNTAAVFDFETKSSYSIRVRTTNTSTSQSFDKVFAISITDVANATYVSSTTEQITRGVVPGSTNQAIVRVAVNITGTEQPLSAQSLTFTTAGTTSPANISLLRVYYTGGSSTFSTAVPFAAGQSGSGVSTFTFAATRPLTPGVNYFWLAYDVAATAPAGNRLDATAASVTVGNVARTPTVTAPAGNRPIVVPGQVAGMALRLTGAASGYLDLGTTNPDLVLGPQYTQEVWVKPTSSSTSSVMAGILGNDTGTPSQRAPYISVSPDRRVEAGFGTTFIISAANTLTLNQWNHVAATFNGSTLTVYVNGEVIASLSNGSQPGTTPVRYVGTLSSSATTFFQGDIDEVAQWTRALSLSEIRLRRHLVLSAGGDGLTSYLQFNEASGNANDVMSGAVSSLTGGISRVASGAPVGFGTSSAQLLSPSAANLAFASTNVNLAFTGVTGSGDVTVTRLSGSPMGTQPTNANLKNTYLPAYWIINKYSGVTFTNANVTYTLGATDISAADAAAPAATLKLFKRASSSDGAFDAPISASAANAGAGTVTFPVTSFSQTVIGTFGTSPLPVELTSFTAQLQGPDAQLNWRTASEKNSAYFEVESSSNGQTFTKLGRVTAQGNTSTSHDYQWRDTQLARYQAPVVYYRLRQVDQDGTSSYSPVRTVSPATDAPAGSGPKLLASPVPFHDHLTLTLQLRKPLTGAVLTLHDLTGREVRRQLISAPAGLATVELLEVNELPTGVYLLHLTFDGQTQHVKVVKE